VDLHSGILSIDEASGLVNTSTAAGTLNMIEFVRTFNAVFAIVQTLVLIVFAILIVVGFLNEVFNG
jgi:hypothetical protein